MNRCNEDQFSIFRPLFTTSFLNYHFLNDESFFSSEQIIITSASSKTSMGLAFLLKKYQNDHGKKIVGLTSERNLKFVESLHFYDEVLTYPSFENSLNNQPSAIVDMAGNSKLLARASDHLSENLKYVSLIGLTDWSSEKLFKEIPNSKFFFAPTFAQKKIEEWGMEKMSQNIAIELTSFIAKSADWIDMVEVDSIDSFSNLYHEMLKGNVDPSKGYIVSCF